YSEKSLGWGVTATVAGALRRATPTTPSTVIVEREDRGTNIRRVGPLVSGGVICTPESSKAKRSLGTTPSKVSPSANASLTHRPSSCGRLGRLVAQVQGRR